MKQKSGPDRAPAERVVKDIRRQTRRQYSAEEKIRIVLEGLRGEENISELCRRKASPARSSWRPARVGWRGTRRGPEALADHGSRPDRVWNRIPEDVRRQLFDLALEVPALAP